MQLTSLYFTLLLSLTSGLPLEGAPNRHLAARSKTYAVVNVDGGSSIAAQPGTTTIVDDQTKTVRVTDAASIITTTDRLITTIVPAPTPTSSTTSISSTSSSRSSSRSASSSATLAKTSTSAQTTTIPTAAFNPATTSEALATTQSEKNPGTSLVTVTITEGPAPTEWYDDGFWHTRYAIKTKWD
ncbi:uncharacterized protein CC84DRAFT_1162082 [Paraphaeosphaeria sporulosa]|uniref:Uncharacterized protein n=1 Tax=Paraphaeosphaeria sporulosa TaxID=1460663 RepID=A0A177CKK8_9PLEO|nr:uncharacterized protein CC84DRAFT_1162082 [Paraphaeosphaeria sporulosa]OAG08074.1 hypothetical protein CC84DRAFT_1162082 [Paraphaeosphaeria sporulosa]